MNKEKPPLAKVKKKTSLMRQNVGKRKINNSDKNDKKEAFNELRSENNKLRKEAARLRKELRKYIEQEYIEVDTEFEVVEKKEPREFKKHCPKCGSQSVKEIALGSYKLDICEDCTYKKTKLNKGERWK
jgi:hypothetical protein